MCGGTVLTDGVKLCIKCTRRSSKLASVVVLERPQAMCTRPVSEFGIGVEPAFSVSGGRTAHDRQRRAIRSAAVEPHTAGNAEP